VWAELPQAAGVILSEAKTIRAMTIRIAGLCIAAPHLLRETTDKMAVFWMT
jgi:hypothetical protein